MNWLRDWFLWRVGKITREERLYRKVRRQTVEQWYRDYDGARNNDQ